MGSQTLVTADLVRRLTRPEHDIRVRRCRMLEEIPFNPLGVSIHAFGDATVLICRGRPDDQFTNNILGLEPDLESDIDAMVDLFQENGVRAYAEAWPGWFTEGHARALADRGLAPAQWASLMVGEPTTAIPAPPADVRVRRLAPGEGELWADLFMTSFGFQSYDRDAARAHIAAWPSVDDWWFYVAELRGQPAGVAMLTTTDGVGYLAIAGTVPTMRGHGCQTALVYQRLADAAEAGCDIACCQTLFDSTSQHNLERCGFRLAATGALWSSPKAR